MQFRRLSPYVKVLSKRIVAIGLLFAIGLSLFFSIYDGVQEKDDLAAFDEPLLTWATTNQSPQLTTVMHIVTDLMSPIAISIFTLVAAGIWMWRKREYWRPLVVVGAVGLAYTASAFIKIFTARARPTVTDLLESQAAISYSFPSGHTIGVAVLLLVLSYFFCASSPTMRRFMTWLMISAIGIALVAFSRVYLGYHWLTDVSASVGLAIIILALVITADTYWRRRKTAKSTSKAA